MSWKDIVIGFGLQKVPKKFRRDFACCWCERFNPRGDLWTDESLQYDSLRSLNQMLNRVRRRVWCRTHAQLFFEE